MIEINTKRPRILFETLGGGNLGLGHVYRAVALANQFKHVAHNVRISCLGNTARQIAKDAGFFLSGGNYYEPDILIQDLPIMAWDINRNRGGPLLVSIVDEAHEGNGDMIFSLLPSVSSRKITHVYSGPPYAILRPEFTPPAIYDPNGPVVVTLGGVDPNGFTWEVVRKLEEAGHKNVHPILGPGFAGVQEVNVQPKISEVLRVASVAITNCGMTLWECAALGIPVVAIAANDRELARIQKIQNMGDSWFYFSGTTPSAVAYYVKLGLREANRLSEIGRRQVDGRGASRVAAKILEVWKEDL